LPDSRLGLLNLVITRGTPPRLEGCRPASRGFALALMTNTKTIYCADLMPTRHRRRIGAEAHMQVDTCPNTLDNVAGRPLSPQSSDRYSKISTPGEGP
jgi:hypothetical protein